MSTSKAVIKTISQRIFDLYDKDHSGAIEHYEIVHMMRDAYKMINKKFEPSKADIDSYKNVLDKNEDGKVTVEDIEQLVDRYLVGDNYGKYLTKQAFTTENINPIVE